MNDHFQADLQSCHRAAPCSCPPSSVCFCLHPPPLWACSDTMHKFRTNFTPHCLGFTSPSSARLSHSGSNSTLNAFKCTRPKERLQLSVRAFYTALIELLIISKIFMEQADFHELWHSVYEVSKRGKLYLHRSAFAQELWLCPVNKGEEICCSLTMVDNEQHYF